MKDERDPEEAPSWQFVITALIVFVFDVVEELTGTKTIDEENKKFDEKIKFKICLRLKRQ